jgi:hypothetical protein
MAYTISLVLAAFGGVFRVQYVAVCPEASRLETAVSMMQKEKMLPHHTRLLSAVYKRLETFVTKQNPTVDCP